jgi:hypothetical protein
MLGASSVYFAMFAAFIIFRVRFESMKRNWVSPAGVPGAVVGMFLAALLFISASAYQPSKLCLAVYFPWMVVAGVYYMAYAQHTQYFSAEEQMKFMKAYILNANKSKGRGRSATSSSSSSSSFYRFLEPLFVPVSRMFGISASMSRTRGGSSLQSSLSKGVTSFGSVSTAHKRNAVAPDSAEPPKMSMRMSAAPTTPAASPVTAVIMPMVHTIDEELGASRDERDVTLKEDAIQEPKTTSIRASGLELVSLHGSSVSQRDRHGGGGGGSALRSSFLAGAGSMRMTSTSAASNRMGWSGKVMTMSESKKFFDVLTTRDTTDENVAEKLIEALPNQFVALSSPEVSEVPIRQEISIISDGEDSDDEEVGEASRSAGLLASALSNRALEHRSLA